MAEDVNVQVIKKTQERLGKYIKKPPLQEKLLKRPPFRFLHDVITNVIHATSLLDGLYTPDELNSDNVKDKESKIKFLQKAIDAVMFITGESLSAKPSKIVAGHEAEKTNQFLQAMAKAVKLKSSSNEAVQKVLNGENPAKTSKKSAHKKPTSEIEPKTMPINEASPKQESKKSPTKTKTEVIKDGNKSSRKSREKTKMSSTKTKDKSPTTKSRLRDDKSREKSKEKSKSSHRSDKPKRSSRRSSNAESSEKSKSPPKIKSAVVQNPLNEVIENSQNGHHEEENMVVDQPGDNEDASVELVNNIPDHRLKTPRPPSAKGPRRRSANQMTNRGNEETNSIDASPQRRNSAVGGEPMPPPPTAVSMRSARPASRNLRSARPASARPAAPKIRQRDIIEEPQARPESVKPPKNIILQDDEDDNEDETFLVEEAPKEPLDLLMDEDIKTDKTDAISEEDAQGKLVKQLLETKKGLEGGSQRENSEKIEIDKSFANSTQRKKDREQVQKEIDKLKSNIQMLTKSAHPLGKLMDYLQEDIDSMQKEWKMWNKEHSVNTLALKQEESLTENSLEPLRNQLNELENQTQDQQDKIFHVKSQIIVNEEKLQKILGSINYSSK